MRYARSVFKIEDFKEEEALIEDREQLFQTLEMMAPKKEAHPKKDQEKADGEIRVIVEISPSKKMNVFKYSEKIIYSKSL